MSLIKSIKQVLGLSGTASENHFWDGSVPNQLSLRRGTPDAPGAELIKALNGALSFPNQGQLLSGNGYVKLPGGLIIQWGVTSIVASTSVVVNYPTEFSQSAFVTMATQRTGSSSPVALSTDIGSISQFTIFAESSTTISCAWIAIGH